jgi:hypothetical protein
MRPLSGPVLAFARLTSDGINVKTKILTAILASVLGALTAGVAYAGPIASRGELQSLLGGLGTLETFEAFQIPSASPPVAATLTCPVLNQSAVCNGQTNLVASGIEFTFGTLTGQNPAQGQWDPAGYFGAPSKEILSNGQPLTLDFVQPVQAFGVDLRAFSTFGAIAQLKFYGADDQRLIGVLSSVNLLDSGVPLFVGWEDGRGIGKVEFQQAVLDNRGGWSPIIDNLEFGNFRSGSLPEPSVLSLLALSLAGLIFSGLRKRVRP